jgi:hypothetical protein
VKTKNVRIERHPAFDELRKRYEWSDTTNKFPKLLKSGRKNPLFKVTGFMVTIS